MEIVIIATRDCHHRPLLEEHLRKLGLEYRVQFFEDDPEPVKKFHLRHSPNLLVDGDVAFRDMPSLPELRAYFEAREQHG